MSADDAVAVGFTLLFGAGFLALAGFLLVGLFRRSVAGVKPNSTNVSSGGDSGPTNAVCLADAAGAVCGDGGGADGGGGDGGGK